LAETILAWTVLTEFIFEDVTNTSDLLIDVLEDSIVDTLVVVTVTLDFFSAASAPVFELTVTVSMVMPLGRLFATLDVSRFSLLRGFVLLRREAAPEDC